MAVRTQEARADVAFAARDVDGWTSRFPTFEDVSEFFGKGDCGLSCSLGGDPLEGLRRRARRWRLEPLAVADLRAAFYDDRERFPAGSIAFDGALVMRGFPHEWHELTDVPELAATAR
jgi:hypothetical protein